MISIKRSKALLRMAPSGAREALSAYVWTVVLVARWIQLQLVDPIVTWWLDRVLVAWEETLKAFLREVVAHATRLLNGLSNAAVAVLFGWRTSARIRRSRARPRAWDDCGSELFYRPAGAAAAAAMPRRGIMEEGWMGAELALAGTFAWIRATTRRLLMLPSPEDWDDASRAPMFKVPRDDPATQDTTTAATTVVGDSLKAPRTASMGLKQRLPRPAAMNSAEDLEHWTVSDAIIRAGYPLETHRVTTSDGYILTMQRIPRKSAVDVVLFLHGVMDTSLTWVSNGVEGSQAFAAYDAGFDVWLGNSRSNPPRAHADPGMMGSRYWYYSINELGIQDMEAGIGLIHQIKTAELAHAGRLGGLALEEADEEDAGRGGGPKLSHRRTSSDSVLTARRNLMSFALGDGFVSDGEEEEEELTKLLPPGNATTARQARDDSSPLPPYRLQVVGHSLGGCSLLLYAVHCAARGRPHHIQRMVLLSPAGFHSHCPTGARIFLWTLPRFMRLVSWLRPGQGAPVYIPSSLLRYVTFKLSLDVERLPGLQALLRAAFRLLLSGDTSAWDRAVQLPHYNQYAMPALSLHTGAHLVQLIRTRRFELFDHGTPEANAAAYGSVKPPFVPDWYPLLRGLTIDMVAGKRDGIVAAQDVRAHCAALARAGVKATYKEFDVGHLDIIFAMKDEIQRYILSRLLRQRSSSQRMST